VNTDETPEKKNWTPDGLSAGSDVPLSFTPIERTRARLRRSYALRSDAVYSLHEAARLADIPKGELRRAILLEEIPAHEVSDDRHYVLDGSALLDYLRRLRPHEEVEEEANDGVIWGLVLLALFPIVVVIVLLLAGATTTSKPVGRPIPSPGPAIEVQLLDR
jgi:hypothetical protein